MFLYIYLLLCLCICSYCFSLNSVFRCQDNFFTNISIYKSINIEFNMFTIGVCRHFGMNIYKFVQNNKENSSTPNKSNKERRQQK